MASPLLVVFVFTTFYSPSPAYCFPFSFKSTQTPLSRTEFYKKPLDKFDLRNFLLGLGGFHGITTFLTDPEAHGNEETPSPKPVEPDFLSCNRKRISGGRNCCPPLEASKEIIDFKFPPKAKSLRVRPAIHMATDEYISKLKLALDLMKALPDDDPRSFINIANVHCTYCDGYYDQVGYPNLELKIHHSWLFYPFHRAYLYFVERIMADLIHDQDFAIPFWSWDLPISMTIPPIFIHQESTLYDPLRDPRHQPPVFADFDYNLYYNTTGETPPDVTNENQREINLAVMHRAMVSGAKTASLFMGLPYIAGQEGEPGAGLIEDTPHDAVHAWVGNRASEDMGEFYSAARDPVFYPHHVNIDRMWSIWKSLPGGGKDFTDLAWLESSFLFYNEKKELVRIKVRDCLNTEDFGYAYEDVEKPWLNKPVLRRRNGFKGRMKIRKFGVTDLVFPIRLDKVMNVIVARPKKPKKKRNVEKGEEEVLVMEGIEVNTEVFVKFDVLINFEEEDPQSCRADRMEFVGSFIKLAHKRRYNSDGLSEKMKTSKRFAISELLQDLGAEEDDQVQVTLVPRSENGDVSIGGIKIVIGAS